MNWFPNYTCMACGCEIQASNNAYLCSNCMATLPVTTAPQTNHYSPFVYEEPIRTMILKLKYADNGFIAKALTPYLAAVYLQHIAKQFSTPPIIIPVPLHRSRYNERGYNQSTVLAKELATYLNLTVVTDALVRTKKTIIQKHMTDTQRVANLKGAFTVAKMHADKIKGQRILLLDDVYTTGATTHECATTLRNAGAKQIVILTIASVD